MDNNAKALQNFLALIPAERTDAVKKMRDIILKNLPQGFMEIVSPRGIEYAVPHVIYPAGYHCNPKLPVPFINIVSQKNTLTIHHMGLYASPELSDWFVKEYSKLFPVKLDMGKGCIKFKKMEQIPFELVGKLAKKITVDEWIDTYDTKIKNVK